MRLRRTGKRGNKVRSRNTRKRQTLRRKKRQSRRKLRGGSKYYYTTENELTDEVLKDLVLEKVNNNYDDNFGTVSEPKKFEYMSERELNANELKKYNLELFEAKTLL